MFFIKRPDKHDDTKRREPPNLSNSARKPSIGNVPKSTSAFSDRDDLTSSGTSLDSNHSSYSLSSSYSFNQSSVLNTIDEDVPSISPTFSSPESFTSELQNSGEAPDIIERRTSDPLPPSSSPSKTDKRTSIVKEIQMTERIYVANLIAMSKNFLVPLLKLASTDPKVKEEDIRKLFSNIEMILNFHKDILAKIEARAGEWNNESQTIGDIFLKVAPFLKIYNTYGNNYENALNVKKKLMKEASFATTLAELEETAPDTLKSLLITPIQRIPRYSMLLADLVRNTPETHPDHQNLKNAHEKMQATVEYLDKNVTIAENNKKFLKLSSKGCKKLIKPHRALLKDGSFFLRNSKQKVFMWLFNDILVHVVESRVKNIKNLEHPQNQWPIKLVWVQEQDEVDEVTGRKTLLDVLGPCRAYHLRANSLEEKNSWLEAFRKALFDLMLDATTREGDYAFIDGERAGSYYSGSWVNGKLHGKGTLQHATGIYDGLFDNNALCGHGSLRYSSGEIFEGRWKANHPEGKGSLSYPGGDYYQGDWEGGKKAGLGEFIFSNGVKYSGRWVNDCAEGEGSLTSKDFFYKGFWKTGKFHGSGSLRFTNGRKYAGEWDSGLKHGVGVLTLSNGDVYEGNFQGNKRHGSGKMTTMDWIYDGDWVDDMQEGNGTMVFPNKDTYTGKWKKGKIEGDGVMAFAVGTYLRYEGEWSDNYFHGRGCLEFRNGSRFEGYFRHGQMHGSGTMSYANGAELEGRWKEGQLDGKVVQRSAHFSMTTTSANSTIEYNVKDQTVQSSNSNFFLAPKLPIFHVYYTN